VIDGGGSGRVRGAGRLCSGEEKRRKSQEVFSNDEKMVTPPLSSSKKGHFGGSFLTYESSCEE
jgi:hypothetical protein